MTTTMGFLHGTPITFKAAGGTAIWNVHSSTADQTGRVSARTPTGADATTVAPRWYRWDAKFTNGAGTATLQRTVRLLFLDTDLSTGTAMSNYTEGEQALVLQSALRHMGAVVVDSTAAGSVWRGSGTLELAGRQVQVAHFNDTGVALSTTSGAHDLTLTPIGDAY